jgi:hypothetical protein
MTDASVPSAGTPREVLAGLGELTRRVRAAQRGAWFPLLLFGVLALGGILVDRFTFGVRTVTTCPALLGSAGTVPASCAVTRQGSAVYWSGLPRLAVPAAFLLLGALGFALTQLTRQRNPS